MPVCRQQANDAFKKCDNHGIHTAYVALVVSRLSPISTALGSS